MYIVCIFNLIEPFKDETAYVWLKDPVRTAQ